MHQPQPPPYHLSGSSHPWYVILFSFLRWNKVVVIIKHLQICCNSFFNFLFFYLKHVQISELKFKLVKAEQEATALEQNVTRLEGQVTRYKSAAENAEKIEDDLKAEKRKLQRELRSALDKVEELESNNSHLSKRLEKMKSTRTRISLLSQT
uniref:Myosin tail domain-containing protein n=1 Tax=Pundamilia nyererei TaxID=303518 RepID=A0A3B4FVV7_9CICH